MLAIACGAVNAQAESEQQASGGYTAQTEGNSKEPISKSQMMQKMKEMRQSKGMGNSGGTGSESATQQAPK